MSDHAVVLNAKGRGRNAPLLPHEIREQLWLAAGVSFTERAMALGKAFRKAESLLDAKKIELVSYKGEYVSVEIPDNPSQLRAAEQIIDLSGVSVGKQEGAQGAGHIHVHYHAPDWAKDAPVDIEATGELQAESVSDDIDA